MKLETIIKQLEAQREAKGISFDELALKINSSRITVWRTFKGLNVPNAELLLKIIFSLGYQLKLVDNEETSNDEDKKETSFEKAIRETTNKSDLKKEKPKKQTNALKKVNDAADKKISSKKQPKKDEECLNCKYSEVKSSGLKIRVEKCDDCKKLKK